MTGFEIIEYCVIDDPPVEPGVIVIAACALPAVAEILGAAGTVVAVTAVLADEDKEVPKLLVAVTV